jgi:hypothetical protein
MDNSVTISKVKENILEFDVDIQGVDTMDMSVRFIIETDTMKLGFDSVKETDKTWSVKIPALSILKPASYPFYIDITVDGYHFMPLVGDINVVEEESVNVSKPKNVTLSPAQKSLKDVVTSVNTKPEEPKEEKPETPIIKPETTFKMEPVKVKDSGNLFKTIADLSNAEKTKKETSKKETSSKKETPVKKTAETKKPKEEKQVQKPKKEKTTKKESVKETSSDTKSLAKNILQDVTGLGKEKDSSKEADSKSNKVKDIIKEETTTPVKENEEVRSSGGVKKFTKDKKFVEVDKSKEENIKRALEEKDSEEEKRSVTTTPFKKKDVTIH